MNTEYTALDSMVKKATDTMVEPVRKNIFKRYPVAMVLVITYGITAVTSGAEFLYGQIPLFKNNPLILIVSGIVALIFTGKAYQKLS